MTKKGFREAMMRGLGRCVLELESTEDTEWYREVVLWGCTHDLSYDTQCEGTRAWYMRELVRRFQEENSFVEAVIQKLLQYRPNGGWAFSYYCELLGLFAQEGHREAFMALARKYEELYGILRSKEKRGKDGTLPEGDDFETLCISMVDIAAQPLVLYADKIAEDIGTLMMENPLLECSFEWLFMHCERTYGKEKVRKLLAKRAKASPAVSRYFEDGIARDTEMSREKSRQPVPQTTEDMLKSIDEEKKRDQESGCSGWQVRRLGLRVRAWIKKTGNTEALSVLAQRYLTEQDSLERAKLLFIFGSDCPFPLSPEPLIQDARAGDETLREAAFYALENVRHEKVHQFALELAEGKGNVSEAVSLLANHYQKEDRELLARLVKSIPVTYDDREDWHGVYSTVLDLLKTKGIKAAPKELLPYLYEHTLCSMCREYIVREMGRRHMVTEELLRECLYDSNYEIRSYARKRIKET